VDFFGDLDLLRVATAAVALAFVGPHGHTLDRQRTHPE